MHTRAHTHTHTHTHTRTHTEANPHLVLPTHNLHPHPTYTHGTTACQTRM
jgi:hypothetical protein